ncbi:MAG: AIPR family protein [Kofleriaceae bacterium]
MNIHVSIIDQQVRGLAERQKAQLEDALGKTLDDTAARSAAFLVLCAKVLLDLSEDEAIEALTEGGNDFGVDALLVGDVSDSEFVVTLFQGKYNHANLEGTKGFPQSGVEKAVQAVRALFDPSASVTMNPRLEAHVADIRSRILDGYIPQVRFLLCSNGQPWSAEAQEVIDREKFGAGVKFEHANHDQLVRILQSTAKVNDTLEFSGKVIVEDLNYTRVFIGKIPVTELARLMSTHGDRLLERNIRRYLGLHGNRVNEAIRTTLVDPKESPNFYFYNNGVTLICDRFDYNALQSENHKVRIEGLQIINGGQTSKTIWQTLGAQASLPFPGGQPAYVLARLYQVPKDSQPLVQMITYATNSQNPVDLKDLRSNDARQRDLELSMQELGYDYRRQRGSSGTGPMDIAVGVAAEAVLSIWRESPQQAKFRTTEHFGKLYDEIFTEDLNGAQVVIAVLLFRIAENKRKRPPEGAPALVRHGSCFAAMIMGWALLGAMQISLHKLDHRTFAKAKQLVETQGELFFELAVQMLQRGLRSLYGDQSISQTQLAATFRRGDLIEHIVRGRDLAT